jgi:hypothetical protein
MMLINATHLDGKSGGVVVALRLKAVLPRTKVRLHIRLVVGVRVALFYA